MLRLNEVVLGASQARLDGPALAMVFKCLPQLPDDFSRPQLWKVQRTRVGISFDEWLGSARVYVSPNA